MPEITAPAMSPGGSRYACATIMSGRPIMLAAPLAVPMAMETAAHKRKAPSAKCLALTRVLP